VRRIFLAFLVSTSLFAASTSAKTVERDFAIVNDVVCPIDLPEPGPTDGWTDAERWAWNEVCVGRPADMSSVVNNDSLPCNPAEIEGPVPSHRVLRPNFLQLLLTRSHWVNALAKPQVVIQCAMVQGELDLDYSHIRPSFFLLNSYLPFGSTLFGARFDKTLSFESSVFSSDLQADRLSVGGSLFLRGGAVFKRVGLVDAKVTSNLELSNSIFTKDFNAESLSVGGNFVALSSTFEGLFALDSIYVGRNLTLSDNASFQTVQLRRARVDGDVYAIGSIFSGRLNAESVSVGGSILLRKGSAFREIDLSGSEIGGNLEADGSNFHGAFDGEGLSIKGNLFLRNNASFQEIVLTFASIDQYLQLSGGRFAERVDFSGGEAGELLLFLANDIEDQAAFPKDPVWADAASFVLRNARVEALQSRLSSWQDEQGRWITVDLSGFSYDRLAGFRGDKSETLSDASAEQLIAWLEDTNPREKGYDPQPYEQLAGVLDYVGMSQKADAVRYAKFEHRDLSQPGMWWEDLLLRPASRLLIGYGVYPFRALGWFFILVAIGVIFAWNSKDTRIRSLSGAGWYSLETALPLIELSENHKSINHRCWWVDSWFHFQKVVGFTLATILVGALTLLNS